MKRGARGVFGGRRTGHFALALVAVAGLLAAGCMSAEEGVRVNDQGYLLQMDDSGVALEGYDAVAYFEEIKAVKGSEEFQVGYNGAIYHFSSARNRDEFNANPPAYTPQFGGYCAVSAALGKLERSDPTLFSTEKNRLVLFKDGEAASAWREDAEGSYAEANANWPRLLKEARARTAMG